MAESLIGVVANPLLDLVIQKAREQAYRFLHFKQDLERLETKLTYMNCYLKDAVRKGRNNDAVKMSLQRIQDIAWDAEDILEECAVQPISAIRWASSVSELRFRHRMSLKIKAIQDRVRSICEDLSELNVIFQRLPPCPSRSEDRWLGNSVPVEDEPVGMRDKIEKIKIWLDEPTAIVMAVFGMGGLGKSLLLQHVFKEIKERYDNSIWLSVSQKYSIKRLQCDVGSTIGLENLGSLSKQNAAEKIYQRLQGTRCLIVLDDVWEVEDADVSLMVQIGLPRGGYSRSQIIISTRSREVCRQMKASPVYEMQHLSEEESWILFCQCCFPDDNRPPEHLEALAHKVEKECARLPLAIKAIGKSMENVENSEEWVTKLDQIRNRAADEEERVMSILRSSYDFLPPQLKPCYLYLSVFSPDEVIDCEDLINLWIAEGFIPMEDCCSVARKYVNKLVDLCLIEPVDRRIEPVGRSVGRRIVDFCKMNDLLRDMCVGICKEYTCFSTGAGKFTEIVNRQWRRISVPGQGIMDIAESARCPSTLRTLRLCSNACLKNIPPKLLADVKALRVLDLSNTDISSLPESVGNMKVLKVLNLRNTFIAEIPACIRGLKGSLQLLDISKPDIVPPGPPIDVPDWIGELSCLRHLSLHSHDSEGSMSKIECARSMPESLAKLTGLLALKVGTINIQLNQSKFTRLQQLFRKNNLGIEGVANLIHLQELDLNIEIINQIKNYSLDLKRLSTLDLRRLKVRSDIVRLTIMGLWHLRRLSELECENCSMSEEGWRDCISLEVIRVRKMDGWDRSPLQRVLPYLQTMPKLRVLEFRTGNLHTKDLHPNYGACCDINSNGFPKLECLVISDPWLKELPKLEDGAMRCLKELKVSGCPQLRRIPDGLERLPNLKYLRVFDCGEMGERLKENNEDWLKMKANNPNVQIIIN